jgi:hypothetical protein
MRRKCIATALLFAAVIAPPASANWFDNFMAGENHKKLVGGTVSPTPDDLRAIGDSDRGKGKTYQFDPKGAPAATISSPSKGHRGWRPLRRMAARALSSKPVNDSNPPRPARRGAQSIRLGARHSPPARCAGIKSAGRC